jgi:simple sugar transport system permease protein
MPVAARQFGVMLWSGAFAGLAQGIQLMGVDGGHSLGRGPALYGYTGIAVALLGRLHPMGIVCAAVFFAVLDNGATALDSPTFPHEIADIVKGVIILLVLAGSEVVTRWRQTAATGGER